MATLAEKLTHYFYAWEERGRGWYLFDNPVTLEPPFTPFYPPSAVSRDEKDDGVHSTYFHFLFHKLFPKKKVEAVAQLALPAQKQIRNANIVVFTVSLPRSFDLNGYEAEQVLLMLSYCARPVSFEIVGRQGRIDIQVACAEDDRQHVLGQLKTFYPTCTILESSDALDDMKEAGRYFMVVEFGLRDEFMRPLNFADAKAPSMYLGMKGIFDALGQSECAGVQILFQGTVHPWTKSILRSVTNGYGDSFFSDAPDMPKLAQKKVSSQLFSVVVRVVASAPQSHRMSSLIERVGHTVMGQSSSQFNALIPLSNNSYDPNLHLQDALLRQSRRFGMLLNTEELATFVHVPTDDVIAAALSYSHAMTKALPEGLRNNGHALGTNSHQGVQQAATVTSEQRFTHTHVIGATGTGKSTFLLNSIVQDIRRGNGAAVLDPHGDLIESVLNYIPANRLKDVILIDPSDPEYSVGFNILKANTELEKEVLSSDLVSVFQRFSTSWGDQMTSVLANTLLAFLESTEGGTLLDVRRFLIESSFREKVLKTVSDPSILYYWNKEFPIIKTNSIGSILTRLDSFLRPKAIRHIFSQKEGLNFADILNGQKILLVKLSHGLIGESNCYLLGSLLVSKIYQTALSRQSTHMDDRKEFYVYIDEFQNFITPSISSILSGGRKYRLGLLLAHQSLDQISSANTELASALIANAGIRVCFRLGESDALKLEKGFASFTSEDLLNLSTGEAVCRVGRSDMDFNVSGPKDIVSSEAPAAAADVIESSRTRYGVLRSTLETVIRVPEEIQAEQVEDAPPPPKHKDIPVIEEPPTKLVAPPKTETKIIDDPKFIEDMVRRKEESKHKYLQMLIKRNAESRGYRATLEQTTKDGKGRVDVVLQKDKLTYAIEVGVTTTKEWEVHNIEKCLADGYVNIIALSEDMKGADLMTRKLTECGIFPTCADKVKVYDLTGFMGMLNTEAVSEKAKVKTVKGYRVKVEYGDKSSK